ncbi:MAG: hypothetical protein ABIH21_00145 [Patescibacteria group bacterium]
MGDGGKTYHRDTTHGYARGDRGFSTVAEEIMSQDRVDESTRPTRRISTSAQDVLAIIYDVTGSVDALPLVFVDKAPMFAGQVIKNRYLDDPDVSVAAVGDVRDQATLQVGDFTKMRDMDNWLSRFWREKMGGGNHVEGYEYAAYFYAYMCDIPEGANAFCVFVADEGVSSRLYPSDMSRIFGGSRKAEETKQVFEDLKRKFKGNVFLLHRRYDYGDERALGTWEELIGKDNIIHFGHDDEAITDLLLGTLALANGRRTLEQYLDDMVNARDEPQEPERIDFVSRVLTPFWQYLQTCTGDEVEPGRQGREKPYPEDHPFPTPDDANAQLASEEMRQVTQFLNTLRNLITSPKCPKPDPDDEGWAYCAGVVLPLFVTGDSQWWMYVSDVLHRSDWEAEICEDGSLRIRRYE